MKRLLAVLSLCGFGVLAHAQDEFDGIGLIPKESARMELTVEQLKVIIEAAQSGGELDPEVSMYGKLTKLKGGMRSKHVGGGMVEAPAEVEILVSGKNLVVVKVKSAALDGAEFTDVIGYDKAHRVYRRWRMHPTGEVDRFTGAPDLIPDEMMKDGAFKRAPIWHGTTDGGETILMRESVFRFGDAGGSYSWNQSILKDGGLSYQDGLDVYQEEPKEINPEEPKGLLGFIANLGKKSREDKENAVELEAQEDEFVVEQFNYRFKNPRNSFQKIDAEKINPEASLMMMRTKPATAMVVVAEDLGEDGIATIDGILELAQLGFKSRNPGVKFGEASDFLISGILFKRFESTIELIRGTEFRYCSYVTVHNGFAYQLIFWTQGRNNVDIVMESEKLAVNFSLIDPDRIGRGASVMLAQAYADPGSGVKADFSSVRGSDYDGLTEQFPAARFGVLVEPAAGVIIVPLNLEGLDCDDESVNQAMFEAAGLTYPNPAMKGLPVELGSAAGTEYVFEDRSQGMNLTYRVRMMRNGEVAVLVSSWAMGIGAGRAERLEEILDCVVFEPATEGSRAEKVPAAYRLADALLLNEVAVGEYGRYRLESAQQIFQLSLAAVPENPLFLENLVDSLENQEKYGQALEVLDANMGKMPDQRPLMAKRASILSGLGDTQGALDTFEKLFAEGYRNEDDLLLFLTTSVAAGEYETPIKVIEEYLSGEKNPSVRVQRWQVQMHTHSGDFNRAAELARKLSDRYPTDSQLRFELVDALLDNEQAQESLEVLAGLEAEKATGIEWAPYYRGKAFLQMKDYRKAKEMFEEAAKLSPGDEQIEQGIALASAALGQGDNTAIKELIEPLEVPAGLRAELDKLAVMEMPSGYNTRIEETLTGYRFEKGKPRRQTEFRTIRVLNQAGVTESNTLKFTFSPLYEKIFVNQLEVFDAEGKKAAEGKVSDYYVSGGDASQMATDERILYVPVPGLKAGYTLKYTVTRENLGSSDVFDFEEHYFVTANPSAARGIFVLGDTESIVSATRNGEFITGGSSGSAYWLYKESPLFRFEALQPRFSDFLPCLALGSQGDDWETIGREYLEDIEDRLEPSDEIKELASKITADAETDVAKVAKITRWMQDEINYQAIEFGKRALIPNKTPLILKNRYGDCKDHSLLMRELLISSGIKAHLTLVGANSTLFESLPSLDQFDHMIVYCPDYLGGHYFDCTSKSQDLNLSSPEGLAGFKVLVLDPEGPRIEEIAKYSVEENQLKSERTVKLADGVSGDVRIVETFSAAGHYGGWLRGYFRDSNEAEHKRNLQGLLGSDGKFQLEEISLKHLHDFSKPFEITMTYQLRRAAKRIGDGEMELEWPMIWEEHYLEPYFSQDRQSPFAIQHPLSFVSELCFDAGDAAWKLDSAAVEASKRHPWVEWKLKPGAEKDVWSQRTEVVLKVGSYPKEEYEGYQRALEGMLDVFSHKVVLRKAE